MKYLVVGGGGREHAIAASLARDETAGLAAVMATRNPGIAPLADALLLAPETDVPRVVRFAVESGVDLAVIGPEAPLEAGLADALAGAGIPAFGPTRAAARIETDKAWARALLTRHGIPGCPEYGLFTDPDEAVRFIRDHPGELAVKPVGLTGGKGVRITGEQVDRAGACAYVRETRRTGRGRGAAGGRGVHAPGLRRRHAPRPDAARAGPQARVRGGPGPEHGRHGVVLDAGPRPAVRDRHGPGGRARYHGGRRPGHGRRGDARSAASSTASS